MNEMDWSRLKVLVVDDEPFIRSFVVRLLGMIGIAQVAEAADGAEGLSKLPSFQPDLVVLDIMMEPMNGLQFLKTVRMGLGGAPYDQPVVVLTGATDAPIMGTAMALDCDAFLAKSAGPDAIKERIARALTEKAAVKPSDQYLAVPLPDVEKPPPADGSPSSLPAPGPRAVEMPINEVEPGAIVDRDVVTEEGSLLLAEGTVLSRSYLGRLSDLAEIIDLDRIWGRSPG